MRPTWSPPSPLSNWPLSHKHQALDQSSDSSTRTDKVEENESDEGGDIAKMNRWNSPAPSAENLDDEFAAEADRLWKGDGEARRGKFQNAVSRHPSPAGIESYLPTPKLQEISSSSERGCKPGRSENKLQEEGKCSHLATESDDWEMLKETELDERWDFLDGAEVESSWDLVLEAREPCHDALMKTVNGRMREFFEGERERRERDLKWKGKTEADS